MQRVNLDDEVTDSSECVTTEEYTEEAVLSGHSGWVWDCDSGINGGKAQTLN